MNITLSKTLIGPPLGFLAPLLLLIGCATPPQAYNINKSWTFTESYDSVWDSTVQLFAENNWSIRTIEKDSGLIVSEWLAIPIGSPFCDCGSPGAFATANAREARFNIFVRDAESGPVLTINSEFRELRSDANGALYYQPCTSTGELEGEIYANIFERVQRNQ